MDPFQIELSLERIRAALEAGDLRSALQTLDDLHPVDRAEAFSDLNDADQATLLPGLDLQTTADLLEDLDDSQAASVAEILPTDQLADVLDEMAPDEAADILGDLTPERAAQALAEMESAAGVLPLLSFADETAGGRMTTSFIALRRDTTAAEAIEMLRNVAPGSEAPYYLYVVDRDGHLVGIVGLRDLVIASPDASVESFMDPEVAFARTKEDQENVARTMARYDLPALPVIDRRGVLRGVITHDDVLDVIESEATEDIYRLANLPGPDLSVDSSVRESVRRRLPWLYLNALTALFAAWVISNFEAVIAQVALLAVFQSLVAAMGGNAGNQTLALIVRAIALGEVGSRSALRLVIKEGLTGMSQGILVGLVVGTGVWLWKGNLVLGVILGAALIGNMLVAGLVGAAVPIALRALRLDPAVGSSVLVTAFTDSIGFALFLGLAALVLPRLL